MCSVVEHIKFYVTDAAKLCQPFHLDRVNAGRVLTEADFLSPLIKSGLERNFHDLSKNTK